MSSPRENDVPRDAVIVSMILESMGITEYEPRVVNQYIELLHREWALLCFDLSRQGISRLLTNPLSTTQKGYTRDILKDALTFAEHAGRASLELDDVRLAIHNRVNHTTHPVSREVSTFPSLPPFSRGKKDRTKFLISPSLPFLLTQVLLELAQQKNIKPLPVIDRKKAFLLPKEDGVSRTTASDQLKGS